MPAELERRKTRITVIGGGSGRFTLLEGLRRFPVEISAIVTMTDSGGSSGRLRSELGVLPPGDVRQCLVALSTSPKLMLDLFNYRFSGGSLSGHSFGNLFLTALEKTTGSFDKAVEECAKILAIEGRVIPVTLDKADLCAQLSDGTVIEGETKIDLPGRGNRPRISNVYLKPKARATQKAVEAILDADIVVMGPGDLFTSVIPNLLVDGIAQAMAKTRATKVLVLPLATKRGETDGFSPEEFVFEIEKYCGCRVDAVVANTEKFPEELANSYSKDGSSQVLLEGNGLEDYNVVRGNFLSQAGGLARHDQMRTAQAILSCVEANKGESK